MLDQRDKAGNFRRLHVAGDPLVLFNIWDAGSAKAVTAAGAKAIATGSWSVAAANGHADGEQVPIDLVMANLARIVGAADLPVTVDLESGYAQASDTVAATIERAIAAGAIGCNLEDSFPHDGSLRAMSDQVLRIRSARRAADGSGIAFFINARTDVLFQPGQAHDEAAIATVLERARAYADAGADGLFVPGLVDEGLMTRLAAASPLPLNVMVTAKTPSLQRLASAGVARVSHGPGPYRRAMKMLEEAARAASSLV